MDKLTIKDLSEIRKKYASLSADCIKVGMTTSGIAAGADEVFAFFLEEKQKRNLSIEVKKFGYAGLSNIEPVVQVNIKGTGNFLYRNVDKGRAQEILDKCVGKKEALEEYIYDGEENSKQLRIVLRNCDKIDPESIDDYIGEGGYEGFAKALSKYNPEKVIEELKISGLRGRGGGGYPTWIKWNFAKDVPSDQKFIICNGDEGDPGAYMDRSILEGDPHSVIEGVLIGGFATGASKGFFYIRAEYPLAIERVEKALRQAKSCGLLLSYVKVMEMNP